MSKVIGLAFLPLTVTVSVLSLVKDAYDGYNYWNNYLD